MMKASFSDKSMFNDDISKWDISGVNGMFWDVASFNDGISKWDTSGVTFTSNMFHGATSSNGDISK